MKKNTINIGIDLGNVNQKTLNEDKFKSRLKLHNDKENELSNTNNHNNKKCLSQSDSFDVR